MKNKKLYIIILILVSLFLISCSKDKNNQNNQVQQVERNNSTETAEEFTKTSSEHFYDQYLNKIWIMEDQTREYYQYFSFYITSIERDIIEGKICLNSLAMPDYYSSYADSLSESVRLFDMSGYIDEKKAFCEFFTTDGKEGFLTIEFEQNGFLEASLAFNSSDINLIECYEGIHQMRPYHLSDLPEKIEREHCFEVELNSWGTVEIISILFTNEEEGWWYPLVYLADLEGNVIYEFAGISTHGTRVYDIIVEDINEDGLKDVNIITIPNFPDKDINIKTNSSIQFIFYQMKNGEFYINDIVYENL